MMGSAEEAGGPPRQPQKATFSGMTMCIGIIALIVDIISVSAPHWGYYAPAGIIYASSGFNGQDNTGHFGPFQHCKNSVYKSFCGSDGVFQPTVWLLIAGLSAVFAILTLVLFCVFALLHVAMQIQRTEICISFKRALFLKFVTSCVAVVATIFAVGLGAVQFSTGGRSSALRNSIGICYYLQIILVFVNILLAVMSYLSYRKAGKHPLNIVSKGNSQHGMAYEVHNENGVSMTNASGAPFSHGTPRLPARPQPQTPTYIHSSYYQQQYPQQIPQQIPNGGYVNNGFTPVTLSVPTQPQAYQPQQAQHAMPMQPIRPIQPVQGIPQNVPVSYPQPQTHQYPQTSSHPGNGGGVSQMPINQAPVNTGGVSLAPGGRTGHGKMVQGHGGSMESLNSTNSSTLSTLSYGSTISTGSGHGPLRSSLKKTKHKEVASDTASVTSSKRTRFSLGTEQTSV